MKEKEYKKELEELFTYPENYDDMSEKEKDEWALRQTMKISKMTNVYMDAVLKKKLINRLRWDFKTRGKTFVECSAQLLLMAYIQTRIFIANKPVPEEMANDMSVAYDRVVSMLGWSVGLIRTEYFYELVMAKDS